MSKIKEYYFEEINQLGKVCDMDYQYEFWCKQKEEDEFIQKYYEDNKDIIEGEKIFNLTNTYPF